MNRLPPPQVNGTATARLNPHDPHWGRFEDGGNALGGIDNVQQNEQQGRQQDIYSRLQQLRDQEITRLKGEVFGKQKAQMGRNLRSGSEVHLQAMQASVGLSQASLYNQLNRFYGAKPDPYGAFSRSINFAQSFSYQPIDPYSPHFGF